MIVWLGALLVVVVAATCARRRFGWVAVLGSAAALLAFSLSNPDLRVAERNVARWQETGKLDIEYVSGLSADAVPALVTLPDALVEWTTEEQVAGSATGDPWSSATRSRAGRAGCWPQAEGLGLGRRAGAAEQQDRCDNKAIRPTSATACSAMKMKMVASMRAAWAVEPRCSSECAPILLREFRMTV